MAKYFNVTGVCRPQEHYMVRLDGRLAEIRRMIDRKNYFSINRGRQYGKTTILAALKDCLQKDFIVAGLDFQFLTQSAFENEQAFSTAFARRFILALRRVPEAEGEALDRVKKCAENKDCTMAELFEELSGFCASVPKPVVLMIDEVDSASNNQVFLDFLALLRGYYLQREEFPTFQSVILAGVYDIRNLKQKGRQYIIEMKIWRGDEYNRRGEEQLASYLESYHAQEGYLLSFSFNKNKVWGVNHGMRQ